MKRSALTDVPDGEEKNVYDIKEKLGEGDYGSVVYKAQKNGVKDDFAIVKKFPSNDNQAAYIKDLRRMTTLDTVHVIKYYGMVLQEKSLWVALEYCGGRSVSDIMRVFGRPLKEAHIRTVLQHSLRGLDYLHHLAIIHRGIKCRNILVNSQGICKLSEFGTAGHGADTITMDSFVGNSFWLAPEVLQEVQYNIQADIWSIGITVIEMCEGNPPYYNIHPMRLMLNIPNKPPPTFNSPDIWTKQLKTFLKCCLQKSPTDRQSATQLLQHKIIKRADYKGMQGITQKAIKVLNKENSDHMTSLSQSGFSRAESSVTTQFQNRDEDSNDDQSWAESGTLVWSPVVKPSTLTYRDPRTNRPEAPTPSRASLSEVDFDEEYEMETVRPSDFAKAKEEWRKEEWKKEEQDTELVLRTNSKDNEDRTSKNLKNVAENDQNKEKDNRKSKNLDSPIQSTESVKKNRKSSTLPETHKFYEESTLELFGGNSKKVVDERNSNNKALSSDHSISSVSRESGNKPVQGPSASKCIDEMPESHTRRPSSSKSIDEIPYFMEYYDTKTPATFVGEVTLVTRTLSELQTMLEDLDYQRGEEMELLKNQYTSHWYDIMQYIEGGLSSSEAPNIYKKLSKSELFIQLSMIQRRHKESTDTLSERFKLEKQFIRDTAKQYLSTNHSKFEERSSSMKRDLQHKEEEYHVCFDDLKKGYRREYEYILKAIEFVDYTMVNNN